MWNSYREENEEWGETTTTTTTVSLATIMPIITTIINIWCFNTFHTHTHTHKEAAHSHILRNLNHNSNIRIVEDNASGFINDRNYSYYYYNLRSKSEKKNNGIMTENSLISSSKISIARAPVASETKAPHRW